MTPEHKSLKIRALTCAVLAREVYAAAATSPHQVDIELIRKGLHDVPDEMRAYLQDRIDAASAEKYDAVVLVYGLCGKGTERLRASRIPIVIARAHDCITLFLGSRERYRQSFSETPGTYYLTSGWIERGIEDDSFEKSFSRVMGLGRKFEDYVAKYGEENARYLMEFESAWENHYDRYVYIDMGVVPSEPYLEATRERAVQKGLKWETALGNMILIRDLIHGRWDDDRYLILKPGEETVQAFDDMTIITSRPVD